MLFRYIVEAVFRLHSLGKKIRDSKMPASSSCEDGSRGSLSCAILPLASQYITRYALPPNPNPHHPLRSSSPEHRNAALDSSQIYRIITNVEHSLALCSPRLDLLLTLVQFNVFRALASNTLSLSFPFSWLSDDALSPYTISTTTSFTNSTVENCPVASLHPPCPPALQPTLLQRTVPHHPWIDLFPFPTLRDNILLQLRDGELDEDELCHDLVEVCHAPSERSGLIIWGEPWDGRGWEVTEEFVGKWGRVDLLKGCGELLEATNFWRGERGEERLVFGV